MKLMLLARRAANGGRICEHCDARVSVVAATNSVPAHFELLQGERHAEQCPWAAKDPLHQWMKRQRSTEERERSGESALQRWMKMRQATPEREEGGETALQRWMARRNELVGPEDNDD